MKQNTILAIILLAMILFILSLPSKAQTGNPSHQLKIEKVVFTGKWKAEITGKNMQGETVTIRYGFPKNQKRNLLPGTWITVIPIDGKQKDGYSRSIIKVNN
jgi:hypothetical protein